MFPQESQSLVISGGARSSSPAVRQSSPAVYQVSNKTFDIFAIPPVLTFNTTSAAGSGAASTTQYIFNNSTYQALDTDNGSGASSITNTYGDGFTGKAYENLFRSANDGRGVGIQGFVLQSTTASTGAQYGAALNTLAFTIKNANLQGGTLDVPVNVSGAINNQQYLSGVVTIRQGFVLNMGNQLSVLLPADTTFAFTFYTETGIMPS